MIRPSPRAPLFPYTTLFRSVRRLRNVDGLEIVLDGLRGQHLGRRLSSGSYMSSRGAAPPLREALSTPQSKDRKSTRLNSSHSQISYAVFCLKKKKTLHTASA